MAVAIAALTADAPGSQAAPTGRTTPAQAPATYSNPVATGLLSNPFVVKSGSTYYAYFSGFDFFLPHYVMTLQSTDLVTWSHVGNVLTGPGTWADGSSGFKVTSPSVLHVPTNPASQQWVMYYTALQAGTQTRCIGLATSSAAAGPFTPEAQPLICPPGGAQDPSALPLWPNPPYQQLIYKAGNTLYNQVLRPDGLSVDPGFAPISLYTAQTTGWQNGIVERPSVVASGNAYYLLFSGSPANSTRRGVAWTPCGNGFGVVFDCANQAQLGPWIESTSAVSAPNGAQGFSDGTNQWIVYDARPGGACSTTGCTDNPSLRIDKVCFAGGSPRTNAPSTGPQTTIRSSDCATDIPQASGYPAGHGPVGWDSYRDPTRAQQLGVGVETRQFSSFDRDGGEADAWPASTPSCLRYIGGSSGRCVIAEARGAGEIDSIWFADSPTFGRPNLGDLRVELDGVTVLDESVRDLSDPAWNTDDAHAPFVAPLVVGPTQNPEADMIAVPMPYRESMVVTTTYQPGYYHVTYRSFSDATGITRFDPNDRALDVIAKLRVAGTQDPKPALVGSQSITRDVSVPAGGRVTLAETTGEGLATELALRVPDILPPNPSDPARSQQSLRLLQNLRLAITFDGVTTVDAPVGEFYGSMLGEYPVRSLMFAMDPAAGGWYRSWWPMPFAQSVKVELVNTSTYATTVSSAMTWAPVTDLARHLGPYGDGGYFAATHRSGDTTPARDWVFLSTAGQGRFVGVVQTMRGRVDPFWGAQRLYMEGDERAYTDGSRTPQVHGTGTEDFYLGGFYFDDQNVTFPIHGHTQQGKDDTDTALGCDVLCNAAYRVMLTDAASFDGQLQFGVEHGWTGNEWSAVYSSTAFWYGRSQAQLTVVDTVDVGKPASETAHAYSPATGQPAPTLTGQAYEGDQDNPIYPVPTDTDLAATTSPITFTMQIRPAGQPATASGQVLLRRTSDQQQGYQEARVYVCDSPACPTSGRTLVGTWLQPLANPHVRWLDDSFALPPSVTAGKTTITVRLEPVGTTPWSAARYQTLVEGPWGVG